MHIVQVTDRVLPANKYGGTERVMWSLAKALVEMGHQITFLAARNTTCDFARVIEIDPSRPITAQIPHDADIAHFHLGLGNFSDEQLAEAHIPIVTTIHGNVSGRIGINTILLAGIMLSVMGQQLMYIMVWIGRITEHPILISKETISISWPKRLGESRM